MINIVKSQPAPACLQQEKLKQSGDYKCGDVLERLKNDFHNKCYICEEKYITSMNVEHFKPHRNTDIELKFDWNNLFLACAHCNNTKRANPDYDNLLNCTDETPRILEMIQFKVESFPKEEVIIVPLVFNTEVINTVTLLKETYNGTTTLKALESANLRQKLVNELLEFEKYMELFLDINTPERRKRRLKEKIINHLQPDSAFTAFKRWIILENKLLNLEFRKSFD